MCLPNLGKLKLAGDLSGGGMGVPTLNRNFVHDEIVSIPQSKTEQKAVVSKLESLEKETQRLESIYQRKLTALEALKKSLLHQAFSGAL